MLKITKTSKKCNLAHFSGVFDVREYKIRNIDIYVKINLYLQKIC
jgi:hypothetical protein